MNVYLRMFLISGVSFGLCFGLLCWAVTGDGSWMSFGLFGGLLFGAAMTLVVGPIHHLCVAHLGYGTSPEALAVRHARQVTLPMPYAQAFTLCTQAPQGIQNMSILAADARHGIVVAKRGKSWKSWGTDIAITARQLNDVTTVVEVHTRPSIRTVLLDFGVSLDTAERIVRALQVPRERGYFSHGAVMQR